MYKLYCFAINVLAIISLNISNIIKRCIFHFAVLFIILTGTVNYYNERIQELLGYESRRAIYFSIVLFFLLLISLIDRKIHARCTRPNSMFWAGWIICFTAIFVMSFFHPVRHSYFVWSILSLSVIPMIMIVLADRDDAFDLSVSIARDAVLISYVFFLTNIIITPFITKPEVFREYLGICGNPNSNGLICTAFFTAALFLLAVDHNNSFVYLLSLSLSIVLAIISVCRTAQLAMILETIAAVSICLTHRIEYIREIHLVKLAVAIVAAVVLGIVAGKYLVGVDSIDMNTYAGTDYEEAVEWVNSNETRARINNLSSDRLILWKVYSSKLTLIGNGSPDGSLMPEYSASKWAHNNALDIGYASGTIALSGYLLWLLAGIIFVLKCMVGRDGYKKEQLFTSLAFIGYFVQAMLEITIYPMTAGIVFLAYMTMHSIAFKKEDKKNTE